jgi:hypothetical protein
MSDGDSGTNLIMQTLLQIQKDIGENTAVCANIQNIIAEHVRTDEGVHDVMFTRLSSLEATRARQSGAMKVFAIMWGALLAVAGAIAGYVWHR